MVNLIKKSDQLALFLGSKNLEPNPAIGIMIERSIELIIAVLGILKSGGLCVPLDVNYPESRLKFIARDSGVNIIFSTNRTMSLNPYFKTLENYIILIREELDFQTDVILDTKLNKTSLNDLIYVLYTSGSTGQPKGVEMPHRTLANLVGWHLNTSQAEDQQNTLQFAPISFDVSFQEIFASLCAGHTLVLVEEDIRKDPFALYDLLQRENISRIFVPTIALQQLAEVANKQEPLIALRTIITAGEQLKITPEIDLFFDRIPDACLYNHYGPTETHVVTSYKLSRDNKPWPKLPPIGYPLVNVETYILDENYNKVEPGSVGELYIGGDCLADGYRNRFELTKQRFILNPFAAGLIYKTGDLARFQADGAINYLGRIDRQVKIRGFRIELGEIEVELAKHNKIKECVVADFQNEEGSKSLIGYMVLNCELDNRLNTFNYQMASRELTLELKHWLNATLPDYMLPVAFIIINNLPLTPSGKVDHSALPLPSILNITSLINKVKISHKSLEEKITFIWEELLQIRPIARDENFFDLGGYSLLLSSLHKILSEVLELQFPLFVLFKNSTIDSLIKYFTEGTNNMSSVNKINKYKRNSLAASDPRKNFRKRKQAGGKGDE